MDDDLKIRNKILNQIVMDDNRMKYGKRHMQKPKPYFAATFNEYNEPYDNSNLELTRPDYFIREERDIDHEGLFLTQRVF